MSFLFLSLYELTLNFISEIYFINLSRTCSRENWFQASLETVSNLSINSKRPNYRAYDKVKLSIFWWISTPIYCKCFFVSPFFFNRRRSCSLGSNYSISDRNLFAIDWSSSWYLFPKMNDDFLRFVVKFFINNSGYLS